MNKKLLVLVGLIALGIGGVSTVALKLHAQASVQPTATTASVAAAVGTQENTAIDTDNIQNNQGGAEKPDVAISQDIEVETNDNQDTTQP